MSVSLVIPGLPINNNIIYREDNGDCYGYSNSGVLIESPFFDWCGMHIIKQNYIEQGFSESKADAYFWEDVRDAYTKEFNRILRNYPSLSEALIDSSDNGLDNIRVDYLCSVFDEEPASNDPNNCSINCSTATKYFANMVSASMSYDGDKYYVAGYYDNLMRGLGEDLSTDSFDAVLEFATELANDGYFIKIKNVETGSEVHYDANVWLDAIENGDVPEDVYEVTM